MESILSLLRSEMALRLGCFAGVFALMAGLELLSPRRPLTANKRRRWFCHFGLTAINTVAVRILFPVGAVGLAVVAEARGWGLLNNLGWPAWIAMPVAVVALDFTVYLQHVMFHAVPVLWRLHQVHHADPDLDVTTGVRFHVLEIALSMLLKYAAILVLGPAALAVLIFEVLLNATSLFNHANLKLPAWLDRPLRLVVVTPDMHRIHHSLDERETNRNFGFNLPWWDYLLGTYLARPALGYEAMVIGQPQSRDRRVIRLSGSLLMPFVRRRPRHPEDSYAAPALPAQKPALHSSPLSAASHAG